MNSTPALRFDLQSLKGATDKSACFERNGELIIKPQGESGWKTKVLGAIAKSIGATRDIPVKDSKRILQAMQNALALREDHPAEIIRNGARLLSTRIATKPTPGEAKAFVDHTLGLNRLRLHVDLEKLGFKPTDSTHQQVDDKRYDAHLLRGMTDDDIRDMATVALLDTGSPRKSDQKSAQPATEATTKTTSVNLNRLRLHKELTELGFARSDAVHKQVDAKLYDRQLGGEMSQEDIRKVATKVILHVPTALKPD